MEPADIFLNQTDEIRASLTKDRKLVVVYSPFAADIRLRLQTEQYKWCMHILASREIIIPRVSQENDAGVIEMCGFNSDLLLVGQLI